MYRAIYTETCTVIFLGDSGVGKSAILRQLRQSEFRSNLPATLGPEFWSFDMETNSNDVTLCLWDTPGDPRQLVLVPMMTRDANAYVIVFDVTDRNSFNNIEIWRRQFVNNPRTVLIAFANKCDVSEEEKEVDIEEARESLRRRGITLMEVSAKTGQNIEEGFCLIANQILENREKVRVQQIDQHSDRPDSQCCCF
jgi:small GTP-binding protein